MEKSEERSFATLRMTKTKTEVLNPNLGHPAFETQGKQDDKGGEAASCGRPLELLATQAQEAVAARPVSLDFVSFMIDAAALRITSSTNSG